MDHMGPKGILEEYCQKEFHGGASYKQYTVAVTLSFH